MPETARTLAALSIADILVFFAVLLVGFAYVWRRGDLDWVRALSVECGGAAPRLPMSSWKRSRCWSVERDMVSIYYAVTFACDRCCFL